MAEVFHTIITHSVKAKELLRGTKPGQLHIASSMKQL